MREILNPEKVDQNALMQIESFHKDVVVEVQKAVRENKIVVIGMATNPFCVRARGALQKEGIQFKYLEYGSYVSGWKPRLAIKIWSGWPTFPQVFVDGKLIGGYNDLTKWIKEGKLGKSV